MRKYCVLYFMLCFSLTVQSQVTARTVAPEDSAFNAVYFKKRIPKITGKLLNFSANDLKSAAINYTLVTPFSESQITKTAALKPDGSFTLALNYPLPYQQIWLQVGDLFYAGLYANEDLYLELDVKKIKDAKGVTFNGDGVRYLAADGPLNIYMNNYVLYKRPLQLRLSDEISSLMSPSHPVTSNLLAEYNKLCDSVKNIEDSYIALNPSPNSWILENERMSDYYSQLCSQYWGKTMDDSLWLKMEKHKSYLVSNSRCG